VGVRRGVEPEQQDAPGLSWKEQGRVVLHEEVKLEIGQRERSKQTMSAERKNG
jgi:hypothetical protein